MSEHLKNMLVGLVAALVVVAVLAAGIWTLFNYGRQIWLGVLFVLIALAVYKLGQSIRIGWLP